MKLRTIPIKQTSFVSRVNLKVDELLKEPQKAEKFLHEIRESEMKKRGRIKAQLKVRRSSPEQQSMATMATNTKTISASRSA